MQRIALPGAIAQITAATVLGSAVGRFMGLGDSEAVLFGFTLATASTVVLLRAVEERGLIKTDIGRIPVGWLLIEDVVIILALVVLPLIASAGDASGWGVIVRELGWTFLKIAAFLALVFVAGRRAIPGVLIRLAERLAPPEPEADPTPGPAA